MHHLKLLILLFSFSIFGWLTGQGEYTPIITGYDWGADINKVVIPLDLESEGTDAGDFSVKVTPTDGPGQRVSVLSTYPSDAAGNRLAEETHLTLVLAVSPNGGLSNPLQYSFKDGRNHWVDVPLQITHLNSGKKWDKANPSRFPQLEKFTLDQKFTHEGIELLYADYKPSGSSAENQKPLIIWLHGGGEGGKDTSVPLMANLATNYASDEIQAIFDGAYVLAPQTPGAWMHNAAGKTTWGGEDDIYHRPLMALIRDYVSRMPGIDTDRIYLGGCSNGGYMTIKLMIQHPDYFAAGFPSALAYKSEFLNSEQIDLLAKQPIWFIHAADDPVTKAAETVIPVYERLKEAGAPDVHLSMFDHAVDVTGLFGGEDFRYNGHFSWIYSHKNLARNDYDGKPVRVDGRPVTVMEWLAAQGK